MSNRENFYEAYVQRIDGKVVDFSVRQGQSKPFTVEAIVTDPEEMNRLGNTMGDDLEVVLDSNYSFKRIQ